MINLEILGATNVTHSNVNHFSLITTSTSIYNNILYNTTQPVAKYNSMYMKEKQKKEKRIF